MARMELSEEQEQELYKLNFVIECAAGDDEAFSKAVDEKTAYLVSLGLTRADVE
jgi:hypothetical protein